VSERAQPASEAGEAPAPSAAAGWAYFLLANLIAVAVGWAIYELIFLGAFLDPLFGAVNRYFADHRVMGALAAAMPFFASLLVGFGYVRRASRRRKRAAAAAESASAAAQEMRSSSRSIPS
jgi:hypothetical protein